MINIPLKGNFHKRQLIAIGQERYFYPATRYKGMFDMINFFSKRKSVESTNSNTIVAVADGDLVLLDKVPDEVFSQKTMGDGVAIHYRME
jgi:hypothetical protein